MNDNVVSSRHIECTGCGRVVWRHASRGWLIGFAPGRPTLVLCEDEIMPKGYRWTQVNDQQSAAQRDAA